MIAAGELISKFQYALDNDWGYIYGKTHEMWSKEKQAAYVREWSGNEDRENSCLYGEKWAGHWVTDCSGLFAWSFSQLGGKIAHGSNSIWNNHCSAKGTLRKGKRMDGELLKPGTAVFTTTGAKHNHIGLYIGNGNVIEAQGAKNGVTNKRPITDGCWTAWGELKCVRYEEKTDSGEKGDGLMNATVVLPAGAKGSSVNMRARPDQKNGVLIDKVPVGTEVEVLSDEGQWCQIRYNGITGWMMSNYLEYQGQGGESGDILAEADRQKIETALSEMEKEIEIIRSTLGRG